MDLLWSCLPLLPKHCSFPWRSSSKSPWWKRPFLSRRWMRCSANIKTTGKSLMKRWWSFMRRNIIIPWADAFLLWSASRSCLVWSTFISRSPISSGPAPGSLKKLPRFSLALGWIPEIPWPPKFRLSIPFRQTRLPGVNWVLILSPKPSQWIFLS